MNVINRVGLCSARVWVGVWVVIASLVSPAAAAAQAVLHWNDDGASFATFGPNAAVTISYGEGINGTCDFIFPATDIYVVTASSFGNGDKLVDVNNTPNTVQLASGGLFFGYAMAGLSETAGDAWAKRLFRASMPYLVLVFGTLVVTQG